MPNINSCYRCCRKFGKKDKGDLSIRSFPKTGGGGGGVQISKKGGVGKIGGVLKRRVHLFSY